MCSQLWPFRQGQSTPLEDFVLHLLFPPWLGNYDHSSIGRGRFEPEEQRTALTVLVQLRDSKETYFFESGWCSQRPECSTRDKDSRGKKRFGNLAKGTLGSHVRWQGIMLFRTRLCIVRYPARRRSLGLVRLPNAYHPASVGEQARKLHLDQLCNHTGPHEWRSR